MVVTRYRTEAELSDLEQEMRQKGKRITRITPFTAQCLTKPAVLTLLEQQDQIMQNLMLLMSSLPLPGGGMIQLQKELYLSMDEENGNVHLRKWWWSKKEDKLCPYRRGVTLNGDELQTIMDILPDLYNYMQ